MIHKKTLFTLSIVAIVIAAFTLLSLSSLAVKKEARTTTPPEKDQPVKISTNAFLQDLERKENNGLFTLQLFGREIPVKP